MRNIYLEMVDLESKFLLRTSKIRVQAHEDMESQRQTSFAAEFADDMPSDI